MNDTRSPRPTHSLAGALLLASLGACGLFGSSGGGGGGSSVASTQRAYALDSEFFVSGRWLVYHASESQTGLFGTDFNLDGDFQDSIAAVVDMLGAGEFLPLNPMRPGGGVAIEKMAVVGDEIFLVVDEDKDGFNWNGDASTTDLVLLHWTLFAPTTTLVATLDPASDVVSVSGRLYFTEFDDPAATALMPGETSLRFVTEAAPTTPVTIADEDVSRTLHPAIHAEDEGVLFLTIDESADLVDLNLDTDMSDGFSLALLDTTDPAEVVQTVGRALENADTPVRARNTGANDWLVAFAVHEGSEGATNLNDPALFPGAWQPPQCAGLDDVDTFDAVLHFLHFAAWSVDPANNPPVNTGLGGRDKLLAVRGTGGSPGFVATLSAEVLEGECPMNGDGDPVPAGTGDTVFRYVEAVQPAGAVTEIQVAPETSSSLILAVEKFIGTTDGVTDLNDRFVIVVDEGKDGRDHDLDTGSDNDLVAWLDPNAATPVWVFNHSATGAASFTGTSWMDVPRDRNSVPPTEAVLPMTFLESVFGFPLNPGDGDTIDRLPVFARFDPTDADGDMDFVGPPVTMALNNPGLAMVNGFALFMVDEAADNRDWNADGTRNDIVLVRTNLSNPTLVNTLFLTTIRNNSNGFFNPQMTSDGQVGMAFRHDESNVALDLNADGDTTDRVIRWVRPL